MHFSLTVAGRTLSRSRTLTRYPDLVAGTGFVEGTTQEVVLAGGADSRVVRLAMLHDDDGCPDHFDVLTEPSPPASPSTSPLRLRAEESMPSPSCQPDAVDSKPPHSSPPWSALRRLWEEAPAESPAVRPSV